MSGLISRRRRRPRGVAPAGCLARRAARAIPVVLVMAALGCGGSGSNTTSTKTQNAAESKEGPLTAPEIEQRVRPSTVSIVSQPSGESRAPTHHGDHAHGSGVIWDASQGLVLTSDHLVENAGAIDVVVNGQTTVHAKLVARAQCNDIAIIVLHPKPTGMTAVQVGDSSALAVGSKVTALGYLKPASATKPSPIATGGEVSAVDVSANLSPDLPDFPKVVLHQAPLQPQMSGGPLVNDRGKLVGVSTLVPGAPTTGQFAAVSSSYLKRRISELEPGARGSPIGWKDQHACHGQMIKIANRVLVSHGAPAEHHHGG
jgi:S1-C subfamily serine protease